MAEPAGKRTYASDGDNPVDTRFDPIKPADGAVRDRTGMRYTLLPRICDCGCGLYYQPIRKDQRFIPEHRVYPTHECPTCGAMHREKVKP